MKLRYHLVFVALLLTAFGILGRARYGSYTNFTAESDYQYTCYVAELMSEMATADCQEMRKTLLQAPVILQVTPVDEPICFFKGRQQRVRVEQIFKGEKVTQGEEILITADRWKVYADDRSMDMGYVNFMKVGNKYLVFLSGIVGNAEDGTNVLRLQSGQFIAPVFSYKECENITYPISGESTYVPYAEVSNNEFFAVDNEGLNAFLALKAEMINKYNGGN